MRKIRFITLMVIVCLSFVSIFSITENHYRSTGVLQEKGQFEIIWFDCWGNEMARETAENNISDAGENYFLDVTLRNGVAASSLYVGLTDSTSTCSIGEADSLTTVVAYGEPSGNGYARNAIGRNSDWTISQVSNGTDGCTETNCYRATSTTETFSASGGSWGPVYCAFLTDVSSGTSGTMYSWAALSTGRTLQSGESLQVTYKVVMQ